MLVKSGDLRRVSRDGIRTRMYSSYIGGRFHVTFYSRTFKNPTTASYNRATVKFRIHDKRFSYLKSRTGNPRSKNLTVIPDIRSVTL